MITLLGATGTIGNRIAHTLLDAGQPVRVVGRSADRLAALAARGAEPFVADASDAAALSRAFDGATAAWTMMPVDPAAPDHHAAQRQLGEATVTALRAAGVPRIVALSSLGAHLPTGTGFLTSLYDQEQRLAQLTDQHVLALRPGWFYDNARTALPLIAEQGIVADSLDADVPVPMVATRDVAAVAAAALRADDWTGHRVRELLGPVDVDQRTATTLLGEAFGRSLSYVRLDDDAMVAAMVEAGFRPGVAREHIGLTTAINERRIQPTQPRTAQTAMPTGYAEYAAALAAQTGPLDNGAAPS